MERLKIDWIYMKQDRQAVEKPQVIVRNWCTIVEANIQMELGATVKKRCQIA